MQTAKTTLAGDFLNWLSSDPRNACLIAVMIVLVVFSAPALMICMVAGLVGKYLECSGYWLLGLGFILITVSLLVTPINPLNVQAINGHALHQFVRTGSSHTFMKPLWWLLSFPYGVFIAGALILVMQKTGGHRDEIKRIARGDFEVKNHLPLKRVQAALKGISSAAIENGTCLGVDRVTGNPVHLLDSDANVHTLAIGTTGSGKTTGIANIIESAILRKHPVIIVDGKGDLNLADKVEEFAGKHNVPCYVFSMLGSSVKYNPLATGGITLKKDRIIALRQWTEEHYKKIAEGYLQTVFQILNACKIQTDLHQLSQYLDPIKLAMLAQPLKDESLMSAVRELSSRQSDISSLKAEIENLAKSEIGHLFDSSNGRVLTLEKALEENAVVFFCLQPLAFPSYAECLGKLIINDIKHLASSQLAKKTKSKIYTIFDEFSVFAGEQIINLINQGRSAGIHAVLSTQSLADIARSGGDALVGQVLNNCNNYLIQRQNNPDDAETLASIIGTYDDFEVTSQISAEQVSGLTGSVKAVKQFLVHPDEIKRLGLGEAIFMRKREFTVQWVQMRAGGLI